MSVETRGRVSGSRSTVSVIAQPECQWLESCRTMAVVHAAEGHGSGSHRTRYLPQTWVLRPHLPCVRAEVQAVQDRLGGLELIPAGQAKQRCRRRLKT